MNLTDKHFHIKNLKILKLKITRLKVLSVKYAAQIMSKWQSDENGLRNAWQRPRNILVAFSENLKLTSLNYTSNWWVNDKNKLDLIPAPCIVCDLNLRHILEGLSTSLRTISYFVPFLRLWYLVRMGSKLSLPFARY